MLWVRDGKVEDAAKAGVAHSMGARELGASRNANIVRQTSDAGDAAVGHISGGLLGHKTHAYRSSGSGCLAGFGAAMKENMPEDRSAALVLLIDGARSPFSRISGGDRGDGT